MLIYGTHLNLKIAPQKVHQFHYDQASLKWLKVFVYLCDVNNENGPHIGVVGTHQPQSKPSELLNRGYSRIPDGDITRIYGKERIKRFTGNTGTIICADTNAYHKGAKLESGYRAIVEINYNCDPISDKIGEIN